MKIESKGRAIELLYRAIPYPHQISDIDLDRPGNIYFTWRRQRYRLELDFCSVMVSEGFVLSGSDSSILIEHLLKKQMAIDYVNGSPTE